MVIFLFENCFSGGGHFLHTYFSEAVTLERLGKLSQTLITYFLHMGKGKKCKSRGVSGKKKGGCQRTLWKGGLCRKCHKLWGEEEVAVSAPRKTNRTSFQKGVGSRMTEEYVHVAHTQMSAELSDTVMTIRADALEVFKRLVPSPPARPTSRCLFQGATPEQIVEMDGLSGQVVNVMRESGKFAHVFKSLKKVSWTQAMFIVAYPGMQKRCAALHRDFLNSHVYSVMFLLTRVTQDNGAVKIFLNSTHWELDDKRSSKVMWYYYYCLSSLILYLFSKETEQYQQRKSGVVPEFVTLMGVEGDVVAFDARLLHQSLRNTTEETRIVFSFSMYDASKLNL